MKKYIYILLIVSCSTTQPFSSNFNLSQMNLDLVPKIENDSIKFTFVNNSKKDIIIPKPCKINTFVHVTHRDIEIDKKVLIKIKANCDKEGYVLKKDSTKVFNWEYKLSNLYNLNTNESYKLYFEYFPTEKSLKEGKGIKSSFYDFKVR